LAIGQSKKIDRLEQYYDQGHYKMVYRKSSRLIKNPEYNSTLLPAYYKAMSSFQLMQNQSWLRRNDADVKESIALMNKVILSSEWSRIKETHANELAAMQLVFDVWLARENNAINKEQGSYIENWILTIFRELNIVAPKDEFRDSEGLIPEGLSIDQRTSMIHYAYEYMGIPYKWGGTDETGFDCSGYTRHVFLYKGIQLPRVSKDQYNYAKKINKKRAFMGDLVFFSEGNGISHVGILVNKVNESKKMIHSSSSKGISVVDIEASDYWSKRIVGFGRVLK
jgi:hypothetical protein